MREPHRHVPVKTRMPITYRPLVDRHAIASTLGFRSARPIELGGLETGVLDFRQIPRCPVEITDDDVFPLKYCSAKKCLFSREQIGCIRSALVLGSARARLLLLSANATTLAFHRREREAESRRSVRRKDVIRNRCAHGRENRRIRRRLFVPMCRAGGVADLRPGRSSAWPEHT